MSISRKQALAVLNGAVGQRNRSGGNRLPKAAPVVIVTAPPARGRRNNQRRKRSAAKPNNVSQVVGLNSRRLTAGQLKGITPQQYDFKLTTAIKTGSNLTVTSGEPPKVRTFSDFIRKMNQLGTVRMLEIRTEGPGTIRMEGGGGGLFAPFQYYSDPSVTGNRQDGVWVFSSMPVEEFLGFFNEVVISATDDAKLSLRIWVKPRAGVSGPVGYTLNPRTPMDLDNPR